MFTVPSTTAGNNMTSQLPSPRSGRKRKQTSYNYDDGSDDPAYDDDAPLKKPKMGYESTSIAANAADKPPKKSPKKSPKKKGKGECEVTNEEKRLRRFRPKPPQSYLEIKQRALSQRLTVLSRERCGTADVPEEKVCMAGTTGNVYTQRIGHVPSCDCPHAKKGHHCKHIVYVMLRVLKAPEHVGYQLALTTSELRDLFKNAAPIPQADPNAEPGTAAGSEDPNRKPIEGECCICYTDFESGEAIVYCKAACGNNVHKSCMSSWMAVKPGKATCPYCRAQWEDEDAGAEFAGNIDLKGASRSEEGYLNVAGQLGLSGVRDYSTYHQPWVRQQSGYGYGSRYRYGRRY